MLQRKKLDALFQLLKEMTICTRENVAPAFSQRMQLIGKWLMIGFVAAMLLLIIIALSYRWGSDQPLKGVPTPVNFIYVVGVILAIFYMVVAIVDMASMMWRLRRERSPAIFARLKQDLFKDADFLARLQSFDKPTLEYGLIQYHQNYGIANGRIGLLAGDIRKIGLFPALTTAAMAAAILLKDDINVPLLWAPLIIACCFYLMGFVAIGQRERVSQVVALVKYSIDHAKEPPSVVPAAGIEAIQAEDVSLTPENVSLTPNGP